MFGQGLDVHVEPLLHLVEHLGVLLRGHEGDAKTLGPKAASTPHPVKIRVGAIAMLLVCDRHVIVDHNVDTLNVNATAHQVGGNQDALLALLELLVPLNALSLRKLGVDGDGGEIALAQQLVQCHGARDGLNEDHHLVEVQGVQQVVKLAVLVTLLQHDVVLHEAMERELGLVVNVDLHGLRRSKASQPRLHFAVSMLAVCRRLGLAHRWLPRQSCQVHRRRKKNNLICTSGWPRCPDIQMAPPAAPLHGHIQRAGADNQQQVP
mmetsp:Transcript_13391/g.34351  ORF Transcript_13391/g.34351 Transcript_13391/m.34351 type:complete len:264 (-) Transcript_13391:1108-1899(-)